MTSTPDAGDHLFISYASEDKEFVRWLALRLTCEGYRIWCDEFKLLGGESYPTDIDEAITHKCNRFLAVLSRSSLNKENPKKERTKALTIARNKSSDFVIPLNIDGIKPDELNWMISDITYIPFHDSWANGLSKLLKKLASVDCPMPLRNGKEIVSNLYGSTDVLTDEEEQLFTNILEVKKIPAFVKIFSLEEPITYFGAKQLSKEWPCYYKNQKTLLSFLSPSPTISDAYSIRFRDQVPWKDNETICDIPTQNVVKNLVYQTIRAKCFERGLTCSDQDDTLVYFPDGLLEKNTVHFVDASGDKTWRYVTGIRTSRNSLGTVTEFRYHHGARFRIRHHASFGHYVQMQTALSISGVDGQPMPPKSKHARSRGILKHWYNEELLNRQLALLAHLADGKEDIRFGSDEETAVRISSNPVKCVCNIKLSFGDEPTATEEEDESPEIIDEDEMDESSEEDDDE